VKHLKGRLIHELVDGLRELLMEKRYLRRKVGREMTEGILPSVIKELNLISNHLKVVKVAFSDDDFAEVTLLDDWNNTKRHTVDLVNRNCRCRAWQITGKPCRHALASILSNRGLQIKDFVHEFYSVDKFRAAYADGVPTMPDRADWPQVELGYKLLPPKQKRAAGRPRVQRIRGSAEQRANKRKVRCRRCKGFGHFQKTCKLAEPTEDDDGVDEVATFASLERYISYTIFASLGQVALTLQLTTISCRSEDEGPSEPAKKKQKKSGTKEGPKKKKKTPVKKKLKREASAPEARVVRSLKSWLDVE
jgi:hypothetical protein